MKTRRIQLIAGTAIFVLCISVFASTTSAVVVWSEDFDNIQEWTLYGYTNYTDPTDWDRTEGNFSIADGTLKVLDDDVNIARRDSDVTVGTWSFDMYIPNDYHAAVYVEIMSNGSSHWFGDTNESHVSIGYWDDPDPGNEMFLIWAWIGDEMGFSRSIIVDPLEGWHHIDVTRTSESRFLVTFNGTLEANFTNNEVTSSTYLQFYCQNCTGAAIDNIVVTDEVPTTTPTTTNPPPFDIAMILLVGGGIAVVVIVLVLLAKRR